jgi:hypothetical protein
LFYVDIEEKRRYLVSCDDDIEQKRRYRDKNVDIVPGIVYDILIRVLAGQSPVLRVPARNAANNDLDDDRPMDEDEGH